MSETGKVETSLKNGVATVSFFHPKGNSLPSSILAQLTEAVRGFSANPEARVILIRSEGDGPFCGGASFSELQTIRNETEGTAFFMGFARLILAMVRAPKFVVTRVHGKAVGGGVGVIAASDYSLAARSASVRLSELAIGIGPFVVGPAIQKKIGLAAFTALAVDTDWRDAEWAENRGLYASLYSDIRELDTAVENITRKLAASNPSAMAELKTAFWSGTEHWEDLLAARAAVSGQLVLSEFARCAIAALAPAKQ